MTWFNDIRLSPMSLLKNLWRSHFLRFLFVGGINTLFSFSIYALWLYLGLNYAAANLLALVTGMIFSFRTQGIYVFNNPDHRLFMRFAAFWALLYLFNIFVISNIIDLGFNAYEAGGISILPNTALSYFLQKHFVFGREKHMVEAAIDT